jgi:hypothetical protein
MMQRVQDTPPFRAERAISSIFFHDFEKIANIFRVCSEKSREVAFRGLKFAEKPPGE